MRGIFRRWTVLLALLATAGLISSGLLYAQEKKTKSKVSKTTTTEREKAKEKTASKTTKAGATFELYKDSAGEFRFRLKDDEDSLLAASGKGYKTKAECQRVIDTIQREAARARVEEVSD